MWHQPRHLTCTHAKFGLQIGLCEAPNFCNQRVLGDLAYGNGAARDIRVTRYVIACGGVNENTDPVSCSELREGSKFGRDFLPVFETDYNIRINEVLRSTHN